MSLASGFPPVAAAGARLLVLGSLPGVRSLEAGQYYAHPRNVFWRLMEDLLQVPSNGPYEERVALLARKRVALWDVLRSSRRRGSLDAAIDRASAEPNDFDGFLAQYGELRLIAFNGRKAGEMFARLVQPRISSTLPPTVTLPSTSPAYAAMPYAAKRDRWSLATRILQD